MKNSLRIGLVVALCAGLLAACEIPQSVRIKSSPGLHVPLGSLDVGKDVPDIDEMIREQFKDKPEFSVYTYKYNAIDIGTGTPVNGVTDVQTYILRYPVADMDNFISFDQSDITIPPVTLPLPGFFGPLDPGDPLPVWAGTPYSLTDVNPVFLPLDSMEKWVQTITFNDDGTEPLTGSTVKMTKIILRGAAALQPALQIKIIKLGIPAFVNGVADGADLTWTATLPVLNFNPSTDTIEVEAQLTEVPDGSGDVPIEVKLQWKDAYIYPPGDHTYPGTVPGFSLGDLTKDMTDAKLKDIPAYLYVNGLDSVDVSINLTATYNGATHTLVDETAVVDGAGVDGAVAGASVVGDKLFPRLAPGTEIYDDVNGLPATSVSVFPLTDAVNATGDVTLDYVVTVANAVHVYNDDQDSSKVTVDIAIILPLILDIPNKTDAEVVDGYLKFNLKPLDDAGGLGDTENPLEGLTLRDVVISMKDIKNSLTDDLFLGLKVTKDGNYETIPLAAGGTGKLEFPAEDLDGALSFEFVALVNKPVGGGPGTLRFKPVIKPAEFEFNLVVDAQADLDMEL